MQSSTDPRPLLILDLDETLIHASECPLDHGADFRAGEFYVYKRPHLESFLELASERFELAIWSSASSDYVESIASRIEPTGHSWTFVWARPRCTPRINHDLFSIDYLKDLRKTKRLGFNLAQTLIVDDSPEKVARNYGNAIYITPFLGDSTDGELPKLLNYLLTLLPCADFRRIEKRGWRHRMTH